MQSHFPFLHSFCIDFTFVRFSLILKCMMQRNADKFYAEYSLTEPKTDANNLVQLALSVKKTWM